MFSPEALGKLLLFVGAFIVVLGLLFVFWNKIPLVGRLPGDIVWGKGGFRIFFPVVTSLVVSAVLTIVINLILRFLGR
jgi:uncharacterized membrane-anchored protein YitT (DUF2179 family)